MSDNRVTTDDPLIASLNRFTPQASPIDRDELLFRAGRASARTPRGWKLAVAALGISQMLLLGWIASTAPTSVAVPVIPAPPPPTVAPVPPDSEPPSLPQYSYVELVRGWEAGTIPAATPSEGGSREPIFTVMASRRELLADQ